MPPMTTLKPLNRVLVTGIGAVTPLGGNARESWRKLVEGQTGVCAIRDPAILEKKFSSKVAASLPLEVKERFLGKKGPLSPLFVQYALDSAEEALGDANLLEMTDLEKSRCGVAIGSGIGNIEEIAQNTRIMDTKGARRISPYFVTNILTNMAAGHVSLRHGLRGPQHACSTACATGANSIGDAYRLIQNGDADIMIAGGTEASVTPLSFAGFSQMRALSTHFNDTPSHSSRPFDSQRDGFVIGEGAGVIVLESYKHAMKRGARAYCEVKGYGLSSDAYHVTAPSPDGRGAQACMLAALREGGEELGNIDYLNAHATSTPLGDRIEAFAISKVFSPLDSKIPYVSSSKGAIGHTLGAAGAIEGIFAILALSEGVIPPTLNLKQPEASVEGWADDEMPGLDPLRHVGNTALELRGGNKLNAVMSNSFGFGGVNACIVFGRPPKDFERCL